MKKSFDAYIFDLDGTLLDTLPDLVLLTNMALEKVGFPVRSEAEILSYVGNGVKALVYQAVPEGTNSSKAEETMSLWKKMYPDYGTHLTKPYRGIGRVIAELKAQEKKLAVLSNKFDEGTKGLVDHFFPSEFDVVYGVNDDIPRKPDPAGLLRVINELDCCVENSIYIGDSPGDMLTSQRAGCSGLCVSWGYHSKENLISAGITALADRPEEILHFG